MADTLNIKVILGSTRQGRFGDRPAQWILGEAGKRDGVAAELLDLRDYPMPFFNEPVSPGMIKEPYADESVQKWTRKIVEGDAFIIVAPEYNHGYPAVLKNALDYVYKEWNRKPVGFVSYGGVGGARAVEQLREVVVELQMAPVRTAVHIQWPIYMMIASAPTPVKPELFEPIQNAANGMLDQLIWWARALKAAREI
jgi:NAD(P)H-dependent FMN reductase